MKADKYINDQMPPEIEVFYYFSEAVSVELITRNFNIDALTKTQKGHLITTHSLSSGGVWPVNTDQMLHVFDSQSSWLAWK